MTPYSVQSTANRFINNEHPESLQKDPEPFKRSIQNHQFQQLNSLGDLSTDNNNKIWLVLLLYIMYWCTIHGNKM